MSQKDLTPRLKFCHNIQKRGLGQHFWGKGISFYLDGLGFEFKTCPQDQPRAPKTREWRKKCEGLDVDCVAKGKKEGKKVKTLWWPFQREKVSYSANNIVEQ